MVLADPWHPRRGDDERQHLGLVAQLVVATGLPHVRAHAQFRAEQEPAVPARRGATARQRGGAMENTAPCSRPPAERPRETMRSGAVQPSAATPSELGSRCRFISRIQPEPLGQRIDRRRTHVPRVAGRVRG